MKDWQQQNGLESGGKTIRKDVESALLVWRESSGPQSTATNCVCLSFRSWMGRLAYAIPMRRKAVESRLSWLKRRSSRNAWDKWGRWLTTRRPAVRKNTEKVSTKGVEDRGSTQEEVKSANVWEVAQPRSHLLKERLISPNSGCPLGPWSWRIHGSVWIFNSRLVA
ncbi:hypothetical protein K438DRAFT_1757764 [Mycena galopus ATCC 62051]|nr:hypothetical protein K438DRAFT_1757764 [Mycena galopus ATCC 62051]